MKTLKWATTSLVLCLAAVTLPIGGAGTNPDSNETVGDHVLKLKRND
jgi:hypothetical protein